jgi:hypothetical protein
MILGSSGEGAIEPGPRERLAAALRPIITMTVASDLSDDDLIEAAVAVEAIADVLTAKVGRIGPRRTHDRSELDRAAKGIFPSSPIIGLQNPLAPPVRIWAVDGPNGGHPEMRGSALFDYAYEGPPSCVHGGVIAEMFDELLGAANFVAGHPGLTGTLTVRFRKPTPLRTPLRLEARCTGSQGRKVTAWGGVYLGDLLTAEAEGVFFGVGSAEVQAIVEGHASNMNTFGLTNPTSRVVQPGGESSG